MGIFGAVRELVLTYIRLWDVANSTKPYQTPQNAASDQVHH